MDWTPHMLEALLEKAAEAIDEHSIDLLLQSLFVLVVGWFLARFLRSLFWRVFDGHLALQHTMLGGKAIYWTVLCLAMASAVNKFGGDLSIFLGAAGVLTVALGFASRTAASNLISGLFLVGEKALTVGDSVQVGTTSGQVVGVDLLSAKLRRWDNVIVRIPNETLLRSEIFNFSHYPIRRLDLTLTVAYKEKVDEVRDVLLAVAAANPYALDEPEPIFFFNGYAADGVLLRFSVWFTREKFIETESRFQQQVYEALTAAGVEFPFPHRVLHHAPEAAKAVDLAWKG